MERVQDLLEFEETTLSSCISFINLLLLFTDVNVEVKGESSVDNSSDVHESYVMTSSCRHTEKGKLGGQ